MLGALSGVGNSAAVGKSCLLMDSTLRQSVINQLLIAVPLMDWQSSAEPRIVGKQHFQAESNPKF